MKKFKKLIALTCVAAMLVPTIAFAEEPGTLGTFEGNGVIENDNSPALDITNVVLPTNAADTYNFTIDANELLAEVDGDNYDDTLAKGVWFKAQSAAPQLAIVPDTSGGGDTYTLYEKIYKEDENFATLIAELTNQTAVPTLVGEYAVWVPEIDTTDADQDGDFSEPTGNGKYEALTKDTIVNYFNIIFEGADAGSGPVYSDIEPKQNTTGLNIFNDKLYVMKYETISAEDAAEKYYSVDENGQNPTLATGCLYVEASSAAGTYNAAALGSTAGQLEYKAAKFQNQGTSSAAYVINKSTFDINVSAKVTVLNATGLTFEAADTDLTTNPADASIYMALSVDGGTATPVAVANSVASATVSVKIDGIDTDASTRYQTSGEEAITGSHQYYRYLDPVSSYDKSYFEITAAVAAGDNWDAYLAAVKNAGFAPDIKVVYSWEKVGTEITATTYSVSGSNAYSIAWAAGLSESNKTIKSITGGMSAEAANTFTFDSQAFVLSSDKNTLTIDGTKGPILSGAVGATRYIKVTFGDDTSVVLELSVQQ